MSSSSQKRKLEDKLPTSSETSDEDDSGQKKSKKKRKHKSKKSKLKKETKKAKKLKKNKKDKRKKAKGEEEERQCGPVPETDASEKQISTARQPMKPMTKEEWEKQQSVVRRVLDPDTGRMRLIKGDGEVLEEIVSKEQHRQINRKATLGDGMHFQSQLGILRK